MDNIAKTITVTDAAQTVAFGFEALYVALKNTGDSGGPSIFQVRISSGEVLSAGDEADMLLAFYQHSYEDHISSLKKGGSICALR